MVTVSRLVTCEEVSAETPRTLYRVRRAWRSVPERFGIYIEFQRDDEQEDFYWCLRVFRGVELIYESVDEQELPGQRYVDVAFNFALQGMLAKTYRLEVSIGGTPEASTVVDFGSPEAAP